MPTLSYDELARKIETIEECSQLSTADLYRALSTAILLPAIPDDYLRQGKKLFNEIIKNLNNEICESEKIRKLYNETSKNEIKLINAIADTIAAHAVGVPPFVIGTLIYRIGLERLCLKIWEKRNEAKPTDRL